MNDLLIGPVTIKAGFGYWDVTRYPKGGDFRRAGAPIDLFNVEVIARYNDNSVREIVATTADKRRVCVGVECIDF